jgi:hypothetical protein
MPTTFPCPVCQSALAILSAPDALVCPFCRVALRSMAGGTPVGQKVRCGKCQRVFVPDASAASLCVLATSADSCPYCHAALKLPSVIPPNKKIKCPRCEHKFMPAPSRRVAARRHDNGKHVAAALGAPESTQATTKSAPKTHLAVKKSSGKSNTQLAPPAALPGPAFPQPALPEPALPEPALPEPALPEPVLPEPVFAKVESPCEPPHAVTPHAAPPRAAVPLAQPQPPPAPAKSAPKTHVNVNKGTSKSKTQLAPPAPHVEVPDVTEAAVVVPTPPRDVDDEDVLDVLLDGPVRIGLVGPEAEEQAAIPDTQKVAAPPPRPSPRPPLIKPVSEPEPPVPPASRKVRRKKPVQRSADPPVPQPSPAPRPSPAPAREPVSPAAATLDAESAVATAPARLAVTPSLAPTRSEPATVRARAIDWRKPLLIAVVLGAVTGSAYLAYTSIPWPTQRPTVYPTEGMVLYKGKPAVGARITLIPEEKTRRFFPSGKVAADGSFKLTTYEKDDGAPVGRYRVTIVRGQIDADEYAELSKKMSSQELAAAVKKMSRDPLYEKYANARTSGLSAEVTSQSLNKLETFNLK